MERMPSEECDSHVKKILRAMATCHGSPPENGPNWGKMLVLPKKGESFLSWLMRQAWAFGITPRKLVQSEREYWRKDGSISMFGEWDWILLLDIFPLSSAWVNALKSRGLNDISKLQLDISKWFDLRKETNIRKYRLRNYYYYNLRYCPVCWKDANKRYFKTIWRLPFVIVCAEHGVELRESCSSCGGLLFADDSEDIFSKYILQNLNEESILKCRHCDNSLLEEVEVKHELAILQNKIINVVWSDSYWRTQMGYLIFWHTYKNMIEEKQHGILESAETRLKLMYEILEKPVFLPYPNFYPRELSLEIERRLQAVTSYLSGTLIKDLVAEFGLPVFMIRRFSKDLLERKSIEEAIKRQFEHRGKLGLDLAQAEIMAFKAMHGRLPTQGDMQGISTTVSHGKWLSYGIEKWNDLLRKATGQINTEKRIYSGEPGLKRAIAKLRDFKRKNHRRPKSHDKGMAGIGAAITRGEWDSFGVETWNDLLKRTFKAVNIERGKYTGKQGLERAMVELRDFERKNHRLPRSYDQGMLGIVRAIGRGEWATFGIKRWNHLLRKTFGRINKKWNVVLDN